jgi:hypothetical protein
VLGAEASVKRVARFPPLDHLHCVTVLDVDREPVVEAPWLVAARCGSLRLVAAIAEAARTVYSTCDSSSVARPEITIMPAPLSLVRQSFGLEDHRKQRFRHSVGFRASNKLARLPLVQRCKACHCRGDQEYAGTMAVS